MLTVRASSSQRSDRVQNRRTSPTTTATTVPTDQQDDRGPRERLALGIAAGADRRCRPARRVRPVGVLRGVDGPDRRCGTDRPVRLVGGVDGQRGSGGCGIHGPHGTQAAGAAGTRGGPDRPGRCMDPCPGGQYCAPTVLCSCGRVSASSSGVRGGELMRLRTTPGRLPGGREHAVGGERMSDEHGISRRTFMAKGAAAGGAVVLAGAAGSALAACSSSSSSSSTTASSGTPGVGTGTPVPGGSLAVGLLSEIDGFYPPRTTGTPAATSTPSASTTRSWPSPPTAPSSPTWPSPARRTPPSTPGPWSCGPASSSTTAATSPPRCSPTTSPRSKASLLTGQALTQVVSCTVTGP